MTVGHVLAKLSAGCDRLDRAKVAGAAAIRAFGEALQYINHALLGGSAWCAKWKPCDR